MKMELPLSAPFAGTVALVGVAPGSPVPIGHLLFRIDPPGGADPGGADPGGADPGGADGESPGGPVARPDGEPERAGGR